MKPKLLIPVATETQTKKEKRDALYRLYVNLTGLVKRGFDGVPDEKMSEALSGYMQLMAPPPEAEEITMTPDEVKQTALLAAQCVARQMYERTKK